MSIATVSLYVQGRDEYTVYDDVDSDSIVTGPLGIIFDMNDGTKVTSNLMYVVEVHKSE